uniref:Uncharacterized protein n=1 Tax=viral metagenome TaxID=1070528 RepID=A0A6M3IK23_9ZZZZ
MMCETEITKCDKCGTEYPANLLCPLCIIAPKPIVNFMPFYFNDEDFEHGIDDGI